MNRVEGFFHDIRYALRALSKSPAFAATALAALALGIGANTAIFSVVNAVLLKPLTYPAADRIVLFFQTTPAGPNYGASATKFNVLRRQTSAFRDVSAYEYRGTGLNLTGGAYPEQIHAIRVSADYFRLFGAPIAIGRTFTAGEDRPNVPHVAVLSYILWQRRFAGDCGSAALRATRKWPAKPSRSAPCPILSWESPVPLSRPSLTRHPTLGCRSKSTPPVPTTPCTSTSWHA
jgi:hypothetical protein